MPHPQEINVPQDTSSPPSSVEASNDPWEGLCDNLRARHPLPFDKRKASSTFLEELPDIHDVLGLHV